MSRVAITRSDFALAYRRFQLAVEAHPDSNGPFVDFQSGLAAEWERYKAWLYREAQRLLAPATWNKRWIGTGRILDHVIAAIQIKHDKEHRNNIVEWESKGRGEGGESHAKLLAARRSKSKLKQAETTFYRHYADSLDGEVIFDELTEQFGTRYDLVSYLFFIRDWNQFMPLRSTVFPEAFELLGVPHQMSHRCNWENYQGFLDRLREVKRHLEGYGIPGGVRLVDAHSFCWMLAKLPLAADRKDPVAMINRLEPEAGAPRYRGDDRIDGLTRNDLDELQAAQRRIGDEAQRVVLKAEKERLEQLGRIDLAARVRDVSNDTSPGYDIESFAENGDPKRIEVKAAAQRSGDWRFFLSENERRSSGKVEGYTFALVTGLGTDKPRIYEFPGPDLPVAALHAMSYEVRLKR